MFLDDVIEELKGNLELKRVSLSEVSVSEDLSTIEVGEGKYNLDDVALKSLSRHLGIQPGYIVKCPDSLAKTNIDHWLEEYGESESIFQSYNGELEKIFTEKEEPIRPDEVLQGLERGYLEVSGFERTYDKVVVEVLSGQAVGEWKVGSRLTLNASAKKKSYVETLWTRDVDGATFVMEADGGRVSQDKKSREEVVREIKRLFEEALDEYGRTEEVFEELKSDAFDGNVSGVVESLLKESRVSKAAQKNLHQDIMADLEEKSSPTYYDVLESLAANSGTLTRSRVPAEELAGKIYKGLEAVKGSAYKFGYTRFAEEGGVRQNEVV